MRLLLVNVMMRGLPVTASWLSHRIRHDEAPSRHVAIGMDLSRHRLDVGVLQEGERPSLSSRSPRAVSSAQSGGAVPVGRVGAGRDRVDEQRPFVHDTLELAGWDVEIADAQKVKGLAPLACKTDRIDVWVLAELS
jgi:transposase